MRVRKVFLLSLVVLTVLAVLDGYAGSPSALWGWRGFVSVGPRQVVGGDARASESGRVAAPLADGEVLVVANPRGSIRVVGEDRRDAAVEYTVTVFAQDEEDAAAYARQLQVKATRQARGLSLDVVEPGTRPAGVAGFAVDYRIAVPRGARVDLSNAFGRVEVQGVGGPSRVDTLYDETEILQVEGDWDVRARFGAVRVAGVGGSLRIESSYGAGHVRDVAGAVNGTFEFGAVQVDGAASLDLRSSYGGVDASRIHGPARLELSFSGARLERVAHDVQVTGRYGDVSVDLDPTAPGFSIDAETRSGRLWNRIGALQGRSVTQSGDRTRFEAVLGDGSRMVRVSVQNGSLTLRQ